ncbi:MAG: hypothetical protein JST90_19465 [Bacteroidetes bacterium]|nr:hypothetical protein [Bacteroidota bacterium]
MPRKLLLAVLILSLLIEVGLSLGIFFAKDLVSQQFGVTLTPDTDFLSYIVGWLCCFLSLILCLAIYELWHYDRHYIMLCYLLGYFWMAIGIAIYVGYHKPDNLVIDTLKGMLIVMLTRWTSRKVPPVAEIG